MKKKSAIILLAFLLLFTILFLALDAINISHYIPNIINFNYNYVSIVINCSVVIGLYLFTFIFIDKNATEKEENQKGACEITLNEIYNSCRKTVELLNDKTVLEKTVSKCNFNVPNYQDDFFMHLQNYPFELENQIFNYANTGILSKEKFNDYLTIKNKYKDYLFFKITFFDVEKYNDENSKDLAKSIDKKQKELLDILSQKN